MDLSLEVVEEELVEGCLLVHPAFDPHLWLLSPFTVPLEQGGVRVDQVVDQVSVLDILGFPTPCPRGLEGTLECNDLRIPAGGGGLVGDEGDVRCISRKGGDLLGKVTIEEVFFLSDCTQRVCVLVHSTVWRAIYHRDLH